MSKLPFLPTPHEVLGPPLDAGTETRWAVRLSDGTPVVVGQLVADLARDSSIRRRYVHDIERLMALQAYSLVPTLAIGPAPNPRDPAADPPWRMRADPPGVALSTWLARAPISIEEVSGVFAAIADAIHAVHLDRAVLRDLRHEQIVSLGGGRFVLVDVGLSRVDVLSSHTASSLLLRGSSYVAPEQLLRTAVDQRSDVWSLGVMMWQALIGELPFGDGPPLLAEVRALPQLSSVRRDVPPALDDLVRRCLDRDLSRRPATAAEVAWVLRGGAAAWDGEATTVCQHCQVRMRVGQRLCLSCGRVAVRFQRAAPGAPSYGLDLLALSEDAEPIRWLRGFIADVSASPVHIPEFLIGSEHMYSDEEKIGRMRLPTRLYAGLTRDTAESLAQLAASHGVRTRVVRPTEVTDAGLWTLAALATTALLGGFVTLVGVSLAYALVPGFCATVVALVRLNDRAANVRSPARFRLREAPAALPASDPLVARLATLLGGDPPGDVRDVIGELALLVQRLVDHRASLAGPSTELAILTEPVEPLVAAIEAHVGAIVTVSRELAGLEEGAMVRALNASEARGEPPSARLPILEGLDRLRTLEDQRAALFHRLLEAKSLLGRTVQLGLQVQDPTREHERQVALALAMLTSEQTPADHAHSSPASHSLA